MKINRDSMHQIGNMKLAWVSPTNVTKVAQALLQLDRIHLQEQYHLDATDFATQLRHALEHYKNPIHVKGNSKRNIIEIVEEELMHLLAEVKAFIALLTPEAQQQLAQQFHSKINIQMDLVENDRHS